MSNTYFQFKQFTVHQGKAAFKVSTDSCLFGAWVSKEVVSEKWQPGTVLDIGTGTGLLMLMLAQQCPAEIDGIEIDAASFFQANENMNHSLWRDRLKVTKGDVKHFVFEKQYDLILANPPFYENDLRSNTLNRNTAMHDTGLKLNELLHVVNVNLKANGKFAVLLPYHRSAQFQTDAAGIGFYVQKQMDVRQSVKHTFFRSLLLFERSENIIVKNEIAIKNEINEYTREFVSLLKDYYLHL